MTTAIHVSHEALQKIGGIGSVLEGLLTTKSYLKAFPRTLLYTPLFSRDGTLASRLGENSDVLYSGLDDFDADSYRPQLAPLEEELGIKIAYGRKWFPSRRDVHFDILAVDIWNLNSALLAKFKYDLWEHFGLQSERYVNDHDYEQYVRIASVLIPLVERIYGSDENITLFAHEYMGIPSALAYEITKKAGKRRVRTIFYAHEVSTARHIVENHPGHDLAFYNILRADRDKHKSLEDEFGSYSHFSRNELVKCAAKLDYIFAVGDLLKDEYMFLCPRADENRIKVVYNGITAEKASYKEKSYSRHLIKDYCNHLFGFKPDYIFTHVTRLVVSKGIWRDVRLLYHLDEYLASQNKKGFFVLLSTLIGGGRKKEDVLRMEEEYGWPVLHHKGWPDLVGMENYIYGSLEIFNAKSRAIKGIFVNQFDFSHERAGMRIPPDATLRDLRLSSDVEFGLSVYEPYGIAQLETLPFGGIPLISSVCGCYGSLREHLDKKDYLAIDFTEIPSSLKGNFAKPDSFKNVNKELRDLVETEICHLSAPAIAAALPKDEKARQQRLSRMQKQAELLDWEHVAKHIISILRTQDKSL